MDSDSDIEIMPSQPAQRPNRPAPLPAQQRQPSISRLRERSRSPAPVRKRPRPTRLVRPDASSTSNNTDQCQGPPISEPSNRRKSLPRTSSSDDELPPLTFDQPRSQLENARREERVRKSSSLRRQEPRIDPATVFCVSSDSEPERSTSKEHEPARRFMSQSQLSQRTASVPAAILGKEPEADALRRLKSAPQPLTCIPAGALDKGKGRMGEEVLTPDSSSGPGEQDGPDMPGILTQTIRARSTTKTVTGPPSPSAMSSPPSLPPSPVYELTSPFQPELPAVNLMPRKQSPVRMQDDEPLGEDSNDFHHTPPSPFEGQVPSRSLSPNESSVTVGDDQLFGEDCNNADHARRAPFKGRVPSLILSPRKNTPVIVEDYDSLDGDYNHVGNFEADLDSMEAGAGPADLSPRSPVPVPKKKRAKGLSQAEKQAEKQAKAEETRLAREAKKAAKEKESRDKKLRRDANKQTFDRKETVAEVRMWVPKSVKKSKLHPLVKACEVLETKIKSTEGCVMKAPGELDDTEVEPKGLVRWIRTRNKEWNEALDEFVPLPEGKSEETREPTVLLVWSGKEVDEMIASGKLLERVQQIQSHLEQDQLFIVISGLETLLKAEKRNQNALIAEEARAQLAAQRQEEDYVPKLPNTGLPKNSGEKLLRELEMIKIVTKCFVIRVEGKNDLANWLWEMTLEIGVKPYKARKQALTSALRLEGGGSKGTNNEDTYIKMLSSLTRVTENEAKGIVYNFPTLKKLYSAWDEGTNKKGVAWAEEMLVGCSKGNTLTGQTATKKLGKVTSKRLYDILYRARDGDTCAYN